MNKSIKCIFIISNSVSPTLQGLCGNCDGQTDNDYIDSDGKTSKDLKSFIRSWAVNTGDKTKLVNQFIKFHTK